MLQGQGSPKSPIKSAKTAVRSNPHWPPKYHVHDILRVSAVGSLYPLKKRKLCGAWLEINRGLPDFGRAIRPHCKFQSRAKLLQSQQSLLRSLFQ